LLLRQLSFPGAPQTALVPSCNSSVRIPTRFSPSNERRTRAKMSLRAIHSRQYPALPSADAIEPSSRQVMGLGRRIERQEARGARGASGRTRELLAMCPRLLCRALPIGIGTVIFRGNLAKPSSLKAK
jgi:hypothetical protein